MLTTFSFGVSSNLSQQKSPTAEIIGIYFLGTIVPRKYMPKISAVRLFCCDKFEETPSKKMVNMSKLTKSYFSVYIFLSFLLNDYIIYFNEKQFRKLYFDIACYDELSQNLRLAKLSFTVYS